MRSDQLPIFVALLLIAVTAWGCGRSTVQPSRNDLHITGRVLDFRTRTGISGAALLFSSDLQRGNAQAMTTADGSYEMVVPQAGPFTVSANGAYLGTAHVTGPDYPGDLLLDSGTCISRYGSVADARTLEAIAGAAVALADATTVTGIDGTYRIDLGCPSSGSIGFNTTFLSVTHPNYAPASAVVGRGIAGVRRLDVDLERH